MYLSDSKQILILTSDFFEIFESKFTTFDIAYCNNDNLNRKSNLCRVILTLLDIPIHLFCYIKKEFIQTCYKTPTGT